MHARTHTGKSNFCAFFLTGSQKSVKQTVKKPTKSRMLERLIKDQHGSGKTIPVLTDRRIRQERRNSLAALKNITNDIELPKKSNPGREATRKERDWVVSRIRSVCVYVYMRVCMCVCVCMHVYVCERVYASPCAFVPAFVYVCAFVPSPPHPRRFPYNGMKKKTIHRKQKTENNYV